MPQGQFRQFETCPPPEENWQTLKKPVVWDRHVATFELTEEPLQDRSQFGPTREPEQDRLYEMVNLKKWQLEGRTRLTSRLRRGPPQDAVCSRLPADRPSWGSHS